MTFIPDFSKSKHIKTFGNSMSPILIDGDILSFKKVSFEKLQVNEIVIFKAEENYKIHRIIYKSEKYIVTKGDNNLENDGEIYPKQIVGVVTKINRRKDEFSPQDLYRTQSLFYFNEINNIIKLLKKNHISYLFLKGLPLYLHYTKNNPQRLYYDCDMLIQPEDFNVVQTILEKAGYFQIDRVNGNIQPGIQPEYSFYKKIHGFPVVLDIHTEPVFLLTKLANVQSLYRKSAVANMTKTFLNNKRIVSVNNVRYPILSPAYLIVYLSLHFFHHNFRGAYRLSLLDYIISKEIKRKKKKEIDAFWDSICDFIQEYKLENYVYPCFVLLKKYYKTEISESFLNRIHPQNLYSYYIKRSVLTTDLFSEQLQIEAGIERFKHIFFLSKQPFLQKVGIFFQFGVWKLVVLTITRKLF